MKYLKFNKKGNLQDILFVSIIIVFFILCLVPTMMLVQKIVSTSQTDTALTTQDKTDITNMGTKFYSSLDMGFLVMLIVGFFAILISAYLIDISPIFAIVGFLFSILILVGCVTLFSVVQKIMSNSATSGVFINFPIISFVTGHLFLIIVCFLVILFIVMYGKYKG